MKEGGNEALNAPKRLASWCLWCGVAWKNNWRLRWNVELTPTHRLKGTESSLTTEVFSSWVMTHDSQILVIPTLIHEGGKPQKSIGGKRRGWWS